ncbi:MAG: RHS repeat-associated core domain-containing protein [Verrucomicrobiota bacterium]
MNIKTTLRIRSIAVSILLAGSMVSSQAANLQSDSSSPTPQNSPCTGTDDGANNSSISFRASFPVVDFEEGLGTQQFFIYRREPSPALLTPKSLGYTSYAFSRVMAINDFESGVEQETDFDEGEVENMFEVFWQDVIITDQNNQPITFRVPTLKSSGKPIGTYVSDSRYLVKLSKDKTPTNQDAHYYRVYLGEGSYLDYRAKVGETAEFMRTASGRNIKFKKHFELITKEGTFRQVKSSAGLVDIVITGIDTYELRYYTLDQIGSKVSETYYTIGEGGIENVQIENDEGGQDQGDANQVVEHTIEVYSLTGDPYRVIRISGDKEVQEAQQATEENGIENVQFITVKSLTIKETQGGYSDVSTWDYVPTQDEWVMTRGGGELTIQNTREIFRRKRYVRDKNGQVVTWSSQDEAEKPWGTVVTKYMTGPDGVGDVINYDYAESGEQEGRESLIETVNGPWTRFGYGNEVVGGKTRLSSEVSPWLDTPTSVNSSEARRTSYRYSSHHPSDTVEDSDDRPRTVIDYALGIEVGRRYFAYYANQDGQSIEIEEQASLPGAAYGASGNMRTTRTYYPGQEDTTASIPGGLVTIGVFDSASINVTPARAGRLQSVEYPDGRYDIYDYSQGSLNSGLVRTLQRLSIAGGSPVAVTGKSTRTVETHDAVGNLIRSEEYVYNGNGWSLVSNREWDYDPRFFSEEPQLIQARENGRIVLDQTWDAKLPISSTDETGIETVNIAFDLLHRPITMLKIGAQGRPNIQSDYDYSLGAQNCGCSSDLLVTRTSGGFTLTAEERTDAIGRISERLDENGYTTGYSYQPGGAETTETLPSGATITTKRYRDGRLKSVTGTGTVAEFYSYGVNDDGTGSTWTRVAYGSESSPRYLKSTYDFLGRLIQEERPAYGGGTFTRVLFYNDFGLLSRITETGKVDTCYEYDELSNLVRSGLDLDGNGQLDLASSDRITDTDGLMEQDGSGDWFAVTRTTVYPAVGSDAAVQVSLSKRRLSGFTVDASLGLLAAEQITVDIYGNTTARRSYIDRAAKTRTEIVDLPQSETDTVRTFVNGLLVSENSSTVAAARTYSYDALERLVGVKEPRHSQSSVIGYYTGTRQIASQTDAAGHTTSFSYYLQDEAGAGQIASVTDVLDQTSYQSYDLLGREVRSWGATDYPRQYGYNSYGELETLTTWRDPAIDFSTATWPSPAGGEVTTWNYDPATGLLTRKQYADGNGTDYGYDGANRLALRTWVRSGGLDTIYNYDPATGELTGVDYEDPATTDLVYTYDRLGRQATVTDATGTRSFAYDPLTLELDHESLDETFYNGYKLGRNYEDGTEMSGLPGRSKGYSLQDSASSVLSAVDYAYESSGRLATVSDGIDTFTYSYVTSSNLLASVAAPQHSVVYGFEANRDVMTSVDNQLPGSSVSRYTYTYDGLGRRADREQSGSAFTQTNTDTFSYNSRSEVTGSANDVLTGIAYNPSYSFDQIGNRTGDTIDVSGTTSYTATELNQYSSVGSASPVYDLDGNLTSNGGLWTYTWNNENRLTSATDGTTTLTFTYDYMGRLVKKDDGSTVEVYVYEGWNKIATFDVQTSTFTLQTSYTWGLDLSGSMQGAGGVGGLLKEGNLYPLYDANGNITQKLDSSGSVVMNVDYDPFGNMVNGTLVGEYGFSTKPFVDGPDWYYYGFRYYDPVTGRWPNRDPIGEQGHEALKRDQYLFSRAIFLLREIESSLVNRYSDLLDIGRYTSISDMYEAVAKYDREREFLLDVIEWAAFLNQGDVDAEFLSESPLVYSFVGNSPLDSYDINGEAAPALVWAVPAAGELLKDLAFTALVVLAVCEAFDEEDEYEEYKESPREKKKREENKDNPLKNREKRNEERRDKPKNPKEKENRQRELEDRKRQRGEGGRGDGTKGDR